MPKIIFISISTLMFVLSGFLSTGYTNGNNHGHGKSHGKKVGDNPWNATTLEWQAPSPPPHGNFTAPPEVFRGPYEYSVPGASSDFSMQGQANEADPEPAKV